jgi:hypothetical protein
MSEFTTIKGSNSYRGSSIWEQGVVHNVVSVELPTTALQTGDITWLLYVPEGAIIVDGYVKADDLDGSGGTSLAYNIGDSTTTNLFFANTTTGQAAGASSILDSARFTKFASATRIKMTVATTAETAVAGTLVFGLSYIIDSDGETNVATGETPITITA